MDPLPITRARPPDSPIRSALAERDTLSIAVWTLFSAIEYMIDPSLTVRLLITMFKGGPTASLSGGDSSIWFSWSFAVAKACAKFRLPSFSIRITARGFSMKIDEMRISFSNNALHDRLHERWSKRARSSSDGPFRIPFVTSKSPVITEKRRRSHLTEPGIFALIFFCMNS